MKKKSVSAKAKVPVESPASTDEASVSRDECSAAVSFPIVGIGASAGGLEAFTQLLKALPLDTGMGFVLVQHLDPEHESALTQILSRATSLPVCDVTNNQLVEPNCVYIIPPDTNLSIADGSLKLQPRPKTRTPHRPIDSFFESLAADHGERAIGVVLSGTASDGTLGLEAIKAEGGITFAQDDSAKYDSMPHSAVAAGCVDLVLSPKEIAEELARIAKHPYVGSGEWRVASDEKEKSDECEAAGSEKEQANGDASLPSSHSPLATRHSPLSSDGYAKALSLLRTHCGVDFTLYKSGTIQRRITRRLVINKQNPLDDYATFLQGNAKELDALCADLLINVTSFFRNPEAFETLQREVLPKLLTQPGDEPIRVWVPGCSTGQEAYSIAIAFMEAAEKSPRGRNIQVFATDLNEKSLGKARFGHYPKSISDDVNPDRLRRFFFEEQGGYRVSKSLREMVVFARQNLFGDPPFSRMDLICCRNLLIYVGPSLQKRAIPTFHYALKPSGILFLGASESVGGFTELFQPVDKKYKIYSRKTAPTPAFHMPASRVRGEWGSTGRRATAQSEGQPQVTDGLGGEPSAQREADRITLNQFAPPGVLVNAELQVLQFRGSTGGFLEPPVGKASFDVLKMAREGLMLPLRATIEAAQKDNKTTRRENVRVMQDGEARAVHLEVIPLKNLPEMCFLILFLNAEQAGRASLPEQPAKHPLSKEDEASRITELETDLVEAREYLQAREEQHERASEELQAASEEIQSANEELQSVNEELETSKEELESANEELTTVNDEMSHRNIELQVLNDDLVNFQKSTRLVVLLLGRDLTIRRFSPQAEKEFGLQAADVGRPISHVRHNLVHADDTRMPLDLEAFCTEVMSSASERERQVLDQAGRWHSLRARPYTTSDEKVDGAVLLLLEIDELKQSEQAVAAARDYAENIVATVRDPLLVLNSDLRVESANLAFYQVFQVESAQTVGKFIYDLGDHQWDIPRLRELLEKILPQSTSIEEFQLEFDFKQLGSRTMLLNARTIQNPQRNTERILLAIEDVTERKQLEEKLQASEALYHQLFETAKDGVLILDADTGRILEANPFMTELSGFATAEHIGKELWEIGLFRDKAANDAALRELLLKGGIRYDHLPLNSKSDQQVEVEFVSNMSQSAHRRVIQCNIRDIRDRSRLEMLQRRQAVELSDMHRRKDEFLAMLSHELRSPLAPIANAVQLLGLQRASENQIQQQARGIIERQLKQLQHLVDDLLEVSRLTTGTVQLRRERVAIGGIIEDAVETVRPLIEQRRQELTVSLPTEPIWLHADAARLEQVAVNLLTNAAKYTAEGGHVWLTVELEEDKEMGRHGDGEKAKPTLRSPALPLSPGQVLIRVRDTGVGITSSLLPHIFELFTQAERSLDRSQGGLGIGLALVQRLTELHDGTVEASSVVGEGSEFVVRLPVPPTDAPLPTSPLTVSDQPTTRPLRVLVVDDNADTVLSFTMLLKASGHDVRAAHDGPAAVQMALDYQPDVVLLDIGLPGLNGYEVAKRIRQQPDFKNVMLVALTGYGQDSDRQNSLQAGFDHHLVKPARLAQLQKILATVSERVTQ
ncbi:MAG: PAS domain S-box protein [Planctomycetaceae bacterium]|nr:PAS domain S-box protein [Planctomycetales bacterium]MCB9922423.1 PAS domain S-box protein [Planctomycetaceae bacterium]